MPLAGFVQVIADEGLPVYHESDHGNLYVEYSVVLPTTLSAKTKAGKHPEGGSCALE